MMPPTTADKVNRQLNPGGKTAIYFIVAQLPSKGSKRATYLVRPTLYNDTCGLRYLVTLLPKDGLLYLMPFQSG